MPQNWTAAIAAYIALGFVFQHAASASVTVAQRSLRSLGGRQVWVPLCSRRGVNGSAPWADNVSTAVMDQQACVSPSWGYVTAVKLVYAAFDMPQQGEVDRPISATGSAAIFVPGLNTATVIGGAGVGAGSTVLNTFPGTGLGANGISIGQLISSSGGGVPAGAYVTAVTNSFQPGSGNTPISTVVGMNSGTTAATANGQPFTFGGLFVPVKFGGKRSFLIEPAHDVVTSDPAAVQLPPSTWFMVRTAASMSGPGIQTMDLPAGGRITVTASSGSFTEFSNRSTTLNDQTMTPVTLSNTGGGYWGPVTLLGLVTPASGQTAPGAVLVLGDSIAAGTGDQADSLGYLGYIQRSLENNVPFVTVARGSTTAFGLLSHGDGQYAVSIDTGITDVLLELGRNDIEQFSISASQLEGYIQSLASRYSYAGKRVWCFTVPPTTYSNDAWTSVGNQFFPVTVNLTGASAVGSGVTQVPMASVANISVGQSVGLNGTSNSPPQAIAPGTSVVAVNASNATITLSTATVSALAAATKLYFGSQTATSSPLEMQRQTYNAYARANWKSGAGGCSGLIDVDNILADQGGSGKWRTDLGQASADGVHPSAVLHQALVNSGAISTGMFALP